MARSRLFHVLFPVTTVLFITVIGFYILEALLMQRMFRGTFWASARDIHPVALMRLGGLSVDTLKHWEVWRLIASAFLHGSWIHIFLNCWIFLDLGRLCEPIFGKERYFVAYTASAIAAGLASVARSALQDSNAVAVGSSGAIFGLVGLILGFSVRHRERALRDEMVRIILYAVGFTVLVPLFTPVEIDHAAHGGGFVAGGLFGLLTPRYVTSDTARRWRIPFWIAIVLTAAALGYAGWHGFRRLF